MKYFVYELYLRTAPFQSHPYGFLIYNKDQNKVSSVVKRETQRAARARCREILSIASQYNETEVIWRNWPLVIAEEDSEESIIKQIKEREVDVKWDM